MFFFNLLPSSRKNRYSHRLSLIRSGKVCATIENTGRSELRLVLRLRINLPVTVSPGAFVVSFCRVLNLENVPQRFRSITSPVKQVWLVVSIKNWIVLKLKKWVHRKKRENDLPCNSLDVDLKIWLSDPNNPRVLSTEILLWLQS